MSVITAGPRHTHTRRPPIATAVLVLLFLGMSLTAVAQMQVDCENVYLTEDRPSTGLTADDAHTVLTAGAAQYWLIAGDVRYPLPTWAQSVLNKFGLLPTECR